MGLYCTKCGHTLNENQFYTSRDKKKYPPNGKLNICKQCITMHVDNWNPETFKWILEEVDIPYVKEEWDSTLTKVIEDPKKTEITGMSVLGKYISKMKLNQWKKYRYADSEAIEKKLQEEAEYSMRAQGMSDEEIQAKLAVDRTPQKPKNLTQPQQAVGEPEIEPLNSEDEDDQFSNDIGDQLTDDDKIMLRLKWGRGYTWEQRVRMEQLYTDMMNSYDIQGAGTKDTLIMICKTSLKTNELLDCGDIEGAQKMSRVYNDLMKSAKLTAAQIKADDEDEINSVGELIAMCEKEGFIERYYVTSPKDHVDRTLQDMQKYTNTLVTQELNLGNMLEAAMREIEADREREKIIETDEMDEDEKLEATLFAEEDEKEITNKDYEEFEEFKEELRQIDAEGEQDGIE